MEETINRILTAKHKRLFGTKPVFELYEPVSESELVEIENQLEILLPAPLRTWYLKAGFGDIDEVLSFRKEWLSVMDRGELKHHVVFAQNDLGDIFAFAPNDGEIYYICRSAPEYGLMASDFAAFIEELENRTFQLQEWIDDIKTSPYDWGA